MERAESSWPYGESKPPKNPKPPPFPMGNFFSCEAERLRNRKRIRASATRQMGCPVQFLGERLTGFEYPVISITCPQKSKFNSDLEVSPWDLLLGISQTIFSPACQHKHDAPAGVLGKYFFMGIDAPECGFRRYDVGDERVFFPHHESYFAQLLQLALAADCCVSHYDGCTSCTLQLAEKLNIKMVVC